MIFHVSGGAEREWENKTWQFRADEDYPTEASEWTDTTLPTHSDQLVGSD
jgi:hypothetical protein